MHQRRVPFLVKPLSCLLMLFQQFLECEGADNQSDVTRVHPIFLAQFTNECAEG